jgi:hypothetical protein
LGTGTGRGFSFRDMLKSGADIGTAIDAPA